MDKQLLAERLKYSRTTLRSLSLKSLASLTGVAASTVQRYETGKINKIKMPVIEAFARALCVNVNWLMGADEPMQIPYIKRNYAITEDIGCVLALADVKLMDADLNGNFRLIRGTEFLTITLEDMDEIISEAKNFALCSVLERSHRHKSSVITLSAEDYT